MKSGSEFLSQHFFASVRNLYKVTDSHKSSFYEASKSEITVQVLAKRAFCTVKDNFFFFNWVVCFSSHYSVEDPTWVSNDRDMTKVKNIFTVAEPRPP